jgi:hypothetical protein
MSAFLVTDEHLNYLISHASDQDVRWWDGKVHQTVKGNEQAVFNKLFRANVESINERYQENTPPMPSKFVWRGDTEPVQVLKACNCFDYQACEVADYEQTEAARIVDCIRGAAIRSLKGYEEAEWEITAPPAVNQIRLSDLMNEKEKGS